jgi:hypothetical protein
VRDNRHIPTDPDDVIAVLVTWIEGRTSLPQLIAALNQMSPEQRQRAHRLMQGLAAGIAGDAGHLSDEIGEAVQQLSLLDRP